MKWCDLSCEYASFPQVQAVDGAGSCRSFAALYCAKLGRLVHKNAPCPWDEKADLGAGPEDLKDKGAGTEARPTAEIAIR